MKIRWQYFLGGLLALLGFGSCQEKNLDDTGGDIRALYGVPTATYKLVGEVKGPSGKPIEGIRVVWAPFSDPSQASSINDTLYTDAKGKFQKNKLKSSWYRPELLKDGVIRFEDVDGPGNGAFKTKELKSGEYTVKKIREGKGWDAGDYEITAKTKLEKAD